MKRGRSIASLGRAPAPEWEEVARAARPAAWLPAGLAVTPGRSRPLALLMVSTTLALLAGG
ncbi:MAG: hypothetical protein IPO80_02970 [Propionibacteriaceae bacterium]|nr:hypothetical protein [Propionibacteriaceae bacterium]